MTMPIATVVLKPKRAMPFYARHPWVFAGAVERVDGAPQNGDEVLVCSSAGVPIARGLYNAQSKIVVRLYSWKPDEPLDAAFFRGQLQQAINFRRELGVFKPGHGCRLVFSEADGLSGMIIDEYDGWLSLQFSALGMAHRKEMLADLLQEIIQPKGIYLRTEKGIGQLEGLELHDGPLRGDVPPGDVFILENGLSIRVNIAEGQKTGYYHDQRDNHRAVATFAPGRRVLDAFSYTGGFGLHCAQAGAVSVECVDISAPALAMAAENAARNQLTGMTFTKADVFKQLDAYVHEGRQYDLIILDPPKFARSRSAVDDALRGYRQLLKQAHKLIAPNGIIVMCCCSGLVSQEALLEVMAQVAADAKRPIQLLEKRGPAMDHPMAMSCPETAYLKCIITRMG